MIADLRLLPEAEQVVSTSDDVAFMECDVSNWRDLEAIPHKVSEAFGADAVADVWIAGAGVFEPKWSSFFHDLETDHYKTFQINSEHPIKLTRIAMRSLLAANKPGVVLIVASMAGINGQYGAALYCASKHAVVGFTKSMAQADADENIKIVCVCPGMVSTPLWTGDAARDVADQYSFTEDVCVSAIDVAGAMVEMVESSEYPGGALLEVSKGRLRHKLESGQSITGETPEMLAFFDHCYQPIRETFKNERGQKAA